MSLLDGEVAIGGLKLVVNDTVFTGWISAEVERSLDEFAPRFSLRYVDRWIDNQEPWAIRQGDACRLLLDDELLIDGYVNRASFRASSGGWELSCEGRNKTGDLVDSSAVHKTGHWRHATATKIIQDLLDPYGLRVTCSVPDLEPFDRFALEQGETVHAAIDRVCKTRALIPVSHPDGTVELLTVSPIGAVTPLESDVAISAQLDEDESDRHSEYLTSAVGVGSAQEAFVKAAISDLNVKRYRPLVVIGDAPAKTAQAKTRAQWECNIRAGRSERVRYTMPGALNAFAETYKPGQLYRVACAYLGLDEIMVCSRATLRSSEREYVTDVELSRPETYMQLAYTKKSLLGKTKRGKPAIGKTKGIV